MKEIFKTIFICSLVVKKVIVAAVDETEGDVGSRIKMVEDDVFDFAWEWAELVVCGFGGLGTWLEMSHRMERLKEKR